MDTKNYRRQRDPALGLGVYGMAEVARYTGLHPSRVRAWFKGCSDGFGKGPLFTSDYRSVDSQHAVSFLDLIDTLVAGQFRGHGVTMRIARAAYKTLQEQLDTRHPFCHRDLLTDGERIFTLTADALGDKTLTDVVSKQQFFLHICKYLKRIDYGEVDRIARRWRIADGIVIDPAISFGKPVVESTGTTTFVLANMFEANDRDAELVADLFNINESDVRNAVAFERHHKSKRAA